MGDVAYNARMRSALLCALVTTALLALAGRALAEPYGWSALAPMAEARANVVSVPLTDGRVLLLGGYNGFLEHVGGSTVALSLVEIYDPATRTLRRGAPMLAPRNGAVAALLPDGRVMVVGGYSGCCGEPPATAEIYDPSSDSWSSAPAPAGLQEAETLTALRDGRLLLIGGFGGNSWLRRTEHAELYDPTTGSWAQTADPLVRRQYGESATLLASGKVLVAGGYEAREAGEFRETVYTTHASTELFDPATGNWTAGPQMAAPRSFHVAVALPDGSALVAGGIESFLTQGTIANERGLASAEALSPSDGEWHALPAMNFSRVQATAAPLEAGKVLIAGGGEYDTAPGAGACDGHGIPPAPWECDSAGTAEVYEPAAGRWTLTNPVLAGTESSVTALGDGQALLAGGNLWSTSRELSGTYLYGPLPPAQPQPRLTPAAPVKPLLSGLRERHRRWRERRNDHGAPLGTSFGFSLNVAATVRLAFQRVVPGYRHDGACQARRPRRPHDSHHCTRLVASGALTEKGTAGANKVAFHGVVGSTSLAPGDYRLSAYAFSAAGRSTTETLSFTIIR